MKFTGEFDRTMDCEYLLTVNVATCIADEFSVCRGEPLQIFLEHATSRFATACVPLFGCADKGVHGVPRRAFRKKKNSSRNGRIDIAIYKNSSLGLPVSAIEIKGFDPSKTSVVADLKRNVEYLRLKCVTGNSQLEYALFGALHNFPKSSCIEDCERDRQIIKSKYTGWTKSLGNISDLKFEILPVTVSCGFDKIPVDPDSQYFELEAHHFVGAIVIFERKTGSPFRRGGQ